MILKLQLGTSANTVVWVVGLLATLTEYLRARCKVERAVRHLALLLLLPSAAHAHDLSATLRVEREAGAEQCAESADLQRRVDTILRRPTGGDQAGELIIDVRFARTADGAFVAHVAATGKKSGQRLLRDNGSSCEALSDAVSVAIALLLDTRATDTTDASSTSDGRERPQNMPVMQSPPDRARSNDALRWPSPGAPTWQAQARIGGGAAYGLGGAGAWLGSVGLGARGRHWLLELEASGTAPDSTEFDTGQVRTSLVLASFRACYLLGRSFAIGPCAELGLGRLRGEGLGFDGAQTSSLPWTAGGLGLTAQAALGPTLFADFGATLWVPTRRQTFSVQNAGIAWESKPVAGVLSAQLGARLF